MLIKNSFWADSLPSIKKEIDGVDVSARGCFAFGDCPTFTVEAPRKLGASAVVMRICRDGENDKDYPFEYELCAIYVHPSYQNKGIGQALFDAFKAKTQDCSFYLYALKGNLPAISFYIKNGGLEIPEYEKALPIENVDATEILFAFQL